MFDFFEHLFKPKAQDKTFFCGTVKQSNFTQSLPFEFIDDLIFIHVTINDIEYKFLLDSAALSVVSLQLATQLSLSAFDYIDIYDAQGDIIEEKLYKLPSLKLAGIEFCEFDIVVRDLSATLSFSCLGIDGILGYNFFALLSLHIDYQSFTLTLSDQKIPTKYYIKLPLLFDEKSGVQFEINFAFRNIFFTLDTGKNGGLSLCKGDDYGAMTEYNYDFRTIYGLLMHSFHSEENDEKRVYLVKDFSIAKSIKIKHYPIVLNDTMQNLVGNQFLKNFDLIIDFKNKALYIKPYSQKPIEMAFANSLGFSTYWNEKDKLYISALTKGSIAEKKGLHIGDRVLAFDARDTYAISAKESCEIMQILRRKTRQDSLELTLQHDNKIRKITFDSKK